MRFAPDQIAIAFAAIAAKRPGGFDFRLYVDGDFANGADVSFWMSLLSQTPKPVEGQPMYKCARCGAFMRIIK